MPDHKSTITDGGARAARAARQVAGGNRMTDVEAVMWHVEKDPFLSSTFGSISLLDQVPDFDRLRNRIVRMAWVIPRLHQRVVPALGRLAPPEWQDDPEFDIDRHLRRAALPSPGSIDQLYDLAARLIQDPFDRTRPLWEFLLIEGLEGGRAALVQKMHHTITDGVGGIRMSEQFIDISRDALDPEPLDESVFTRDTPPTTPHPLLLAMGTFTHSWQRALGLAQKAAADAVEVARHPSELLTRPVRAAESARSTVRQLAVIDGARSPLWTARSLHRRFLTMDLDFEAAYRSAKGLGGSLNDYFVAAATGGAGAYHRRFGAEVGELRMAMPVSTRTDRSAGGNRFVPTRVLVPAHLVDPVERFNAVHDVLTATKREMAIGVMEEAAGLAGLVPTSVLTRIARRQTETIDFTTSNVRAAPFELFIAGAGLDGTYPLGPLAGTAFNLTMMSYCGRLNLGLHVDAAAIEEPEVLRDCLAESFAELAAAGS